MWQTFNNAFTGDYGQYGQLFTQLQEVLFGRIFLLVMTIIPCVFLLHYMVIGPKRFAHDGPQVFFFGLLSRIVHWIAAASFSFLVLTGLMVIFAKPLGGGTLVIGGRLVHIASGIIFTIAAIPMFFIWLKDMFPTLYDIKWFCILGGYLSKNKVPVPAGKFNGGQKIWFWLATLGSFVLAYSGYVLWFFQGSVDTIRLMAIIHNCLAAILVAMFLTHLYMSIFAIAGSLTSMITGYKPKEEVAILHSRYKS
jgi:formate dehydrogenase subunit gamma